MKGLRWSILYYFPQTEMTLKLLIQSLTPPLPPPLRLLLLPSGSSLLCHPVPRDQDVYGTRAGKQAPRLIRVPYIHVIRRAEPLRSNFFFFF